MAQNLDENINKASYFSDHMGILENQKKIEEEFSGFSDWEARYKRIIDLGKELPDLSADKKTEEAKVKGCQSQVWMHAHMKDGRMIIEADSDAMIVKGLVAVLVKIYSGEDPKEIMKHSPDFFEKLGFKSHLSPSRANGFFAMIKQIKYFATAFSLMGKWLGRGLLEFGAFVRCDALREL